MAKPQPDRVHPEIARRALREAKQRTAIWSEYIILHWRGTGNLAPGCDLQDLIVWLEANEAEALAAKTGMGFGTAMQKQG